MLRKRSIRSPALLGALALGLTTAVVASASAARRDTAISLAVRPSVTAATGPSRLPERSRPARLTKW